MSATIEQVKKMHVCERCKVSDGLYFVGEDLVKCYVCDEAVRRFFGFSSLENAARTLFKEVHAALGHDELAGRFDDGLVPPRKLAWLEIARVLEERVGPDGFSVTEYADKLYKHVHGRLNDGFVEYDVSSRHPGVWLAWMEIADNLAKRLETTAPREPEHRWRADPPTPAELKDPRNVAWHFRGTFCPPEHRESYLRAQEASPIEYRRPYDTTEHGIVVKVYDGIPAEDDPWVEWRKHVWLMKNLRGEWCPARAPAERREAGVSK